MDEHGCGMEVAEVAAWDERVVGWAAGWMEAAETAGAEVAGVKAADWAEAIIQEAVGWKERQGSLNYKPDFPESPHIPPPADLPSPLSQV